MKVLDPGVYTFGIKIKPRYDDFDAYIAINGLGF